jgi:hypothetical protein
LRGVDVGVLREQRQCVVTFAVRDEVGEVLRVNAVRAEQQHGADECADFHAWLP